MSPIRVLSIAGSDSSGCAGLQADLRTFSAMGVFGLSAVTAVTAQDGRRVRALEKVSEGTLKAQIQSAFSLRPSAAKTGLLPSASAVRLVAELFSKGSLPLVVDPVLRSSSGTRFLPTAAVRILASKLLPLATLVTPNWPEAEEIAGIRVRNHTQAQEAGMRISEMGCAVLVKGGHASRGPCRDCLIVDGEARWFEGERIATRNTRGTGCVLSAGIAAHLALGCTLGDAVLKARAFLIEGLREGLGVGWGGAGPSFGGIGRRLKGHSRKGFD